jgi:pantetheine-phosphate adenylyltransferase
MFIRIFSGDPFIMLRAIFPASFDPIHFGHIDIAQRAARLFDELHVAVYDRPAKQVLFSSEERMKLVRQSLGHIANIHVATYSGLTVDYARQVGATVIVRGLRVFSDFELEFRMALANRRLTPEIEVVNLIAGEQFLHISSSTVREIASLGGDVSTFAPPHVVDALRVKFHDLNRNGGAPNYVTSLQD